MCGDRVIYKEFCVHKTNFVCFLVSELLKTAEPFSRGFYVINVVVVHIPKVTNVRIDNSYHGVLESISVEIGANLASWMQILAHVICKKYSLFKQSILILDT